MPIRRWLRSQGVTQADLWLGISLDEFQRTKPSDVRYIRNVYPLIERRITRASCLLWLEAHELPAPPKSACVFCPYSNKTAWQALKRKGGEDWETAVAVDEAIRRRRQAQGFELFVHPARRPLPEAIVLPEDHGARQLALPTLELPCDSGYCFT